jgi:hypothetical protein
MQVKRRLAYLLLLDPDSPSARWCTVDTAWECDLELLEDE